MEWTKDKPTKDGHYWVRNYSDPFDRLDLEPTVVRITSPYGYSPLEVYFPGCDSQYEVDMGDGAEWFGPLDLPA